MAQEKFAEEVGAIEVMGRVLERLKETGHGDARLEIRSFPDHLSYPDHHQVLVGWDFETESGVCRGVVLTTQDHPQKQKRGVIVEGKPFHSLSEGEWRDKAVLEEAILAASQNPVELTSAIFLEK